MKQYSSQDLLQIIASRWYLQAAAILLVGAIPALAVPLADQSGAELKVYTWVIIVAIFCSFFGAFGIGANDVANAFATSVGAKSLTIKQAVLVAAIFEFCGAFFMGSHVTKTIRKGITDRKYFEDDPEILMFGMMCVTFSLAVWLWVATYFKLPVSTTHTCVGSIMGFTICAKGFDAVQWDVVMWIVISWFLSPIASGIFAVTLYKIIVYAVLKREDPGTTTLYTYPIWVGLCVWVCCFYTIYKGTPSLGLKDTPVGLALIISFSAAAGMALLTFFLVVPFLRRRMDDPEAVKDFEKTVLNQNLGIEDVEMQTADAGTMETAGETGGEVEKEELDEFDEAVVMESYLAEVRGELGTEPKLCVVHLHPRGYFVVDGERVESARVKVLDSEVEGAASEQKRGEPMVDRDADDNMPDVVEKGDKETDLDDAGNTGGLLKAVDTFVPDVHSNFEKTLEKDPYLKKMLAQTTIYDSRAELGFSYLQVFSACFDAFAHGANDVANSIGPLAVVYAIWDSGEVKKKVDVQTWILAVGSVGIVVGLAGYGYKIIEAIGLELTKLSPSRGFSIELGAALVVITGSRMEIPLSTTHCQVGATMGVGASEGCHLVNWWMVMRVCAGWIATIIVAAFCTGLVFSFAVCAPSINE